MNKFVFAAWLAVWNDFCENITHEELAVAISHEPNCLQDAVVLFRWSKKVSYGSVLDCSTINLEVANRHHTEEDFQEAYSQRVLDFWEQAGGEYPEVELKDDNARRIRKDDPAGSQGSHKSVSGNSRSTGAKSVTANVRKLDKNARRS